MLFANNKAQTRLYAINFSTELQHHAQPCAWCEQLTNRYDFVLQFVCSFFFTLSIEIHVANTKSTGNVWPLPKWSMFIPYNHCAYLLISLIMFRDKNQIFLSLRLKRLRNKQRHPIFLENKIAWGWSELTLKSTWSKERSPSPVTNKILFTGSVSNWNQIFRSSGVVFEEIFGEWLASVRRVLPTPNCLTVSSGTWHRSFSLPTLCLVLEPGNDFPDLATYMDTKSSSILDWVIDFQCSTSKYTGKLWCYPINKGLGISLCVSLRTTTVEQGHWD